MKKTTLLIMAAGIGSRYGAGIKQLATVDAHNHIIMDYSIHDAILAGFNQIVFIIRKDIESDFKEVIGDRISALCNSKGVAVSYCFQDLFDIPGTVPEGRTKPWGTGQAVLAARDIIDSPFAVINADDYYGASAFYSIHNWLIQDHRSPSDFCMAGFILKNTLSDNGTVTRGICEVADGYLTNVIETSNIAKTESGASVDGTPVNADSLVSMNMWGLTPEFMTTLSDNFKTFFTETVPSNPIKAEYLLPILIGDLLQKHQVTVQVLESHDKWFGVTYAEDKESVTASFRDLIERGVYKEDLYSDL